MLAYTAEHNDIYFFFEKDDIKRLEKGPVQGIYFNRKDMNITAKLKVSISNKIHEMSVIENEYDEEGFVTKMHLQIWSNKYDEFKLNKSADIHEGYRHIIFRNAANKNRLTWFELFNYNQLKEYISTTLVKSK